MRGAWAGLMAVSAAVAAAACTNDQVREAPAEDQVAVFESERQLAQAVTALDRRPFVAIPQQGTTRWVTSAAALTKAPAGLRYQEPLVQYDLSLVPSDSRFREQWALKDIEAPAAWDRVPSAEGMVVAVVDSGVNLEHPDLAGSLWVNEDEVPDNGLDDDGNGFVDDVHGWDFVENDGDPSPGGSDEYSNHGTHVAGIIGAMTDNAKGIAGVAPGVRLMVLRTMDGRSGRSDAIADAIDYAVENGAKVVNLSLGGAYSKLLDEALARAWKKGVIVVAAAGNSGAQGAEFPASSDVAGVVGVGATDEQGQVASFSNFGPGVDLTAPGVDILSTFGPRSYRALSGTSMATPHVSGALALALSASAGHHAPTLDALLKRLPNGSSGVARLDLAALVDAAPARTPSSPSAGLTLKRKRLTFEAASASARPPPQTVTIGAASPTTFTIDAPSWVHPGTCRQAPCRLSFTADPSHLGYGAHEGTITLKPARGEASTLLVELFVGQESTKSLSLNALVDDQPQSVEGELQVQPGALVTLELQSAGRRAWAHWSVDGTVHPGTRLRGVFRAPGRYTVAAAARDGREVRVDVVVAPAGESLAAPGVDLP